MRPTGLSRALTDSQLTTALGKPRPSLVDRIESEAYTSNQLKVRLEI